MSQATVRRRMQLYGLSIRQTYAPLPDTELDDLVAEIVSEHPNSGYRMIRSHLLNRGLRIQERRVRESLARTDPLSVAYRWSRNGRIHRRQYSVPYPNAIWHIDGNMSLNRWSFTVHGAVDGYSRLVTYLHCSTYNNSETVLAQFVRGGERYGFPSRVRSDFGGENISVAHFMTLVRGTDRGSHLTGRSVNNQRIERFWRDVFTGCLSTYYHLFYFMENNGILDIENDLHIFALQYVYRPRINRSLVAFLGAWNRHPIRTAGNLSPIQLWVTGMLQNYHSAHLPIQEVFASEATSMTDYVPDVDRSRTTESEDNGSLHGVPLQDLEQSIDPLQESFVWGIDIYVSVLEFLIDVASESSD